MTTNTYSPHHIRDGSHPPGLSSPAPASSSLFFHRAALWESVEKELHHARRSVVLTHVLVSERWAPTSVEKHMDTFQQGEACSPGSVITPAPLSSCVSPDSLGYGDGRPYRGSDHHHHKGAAVWHRPVPPLHTIAERRLPFVEYWEPPDVGRTLIAVALPDRLVLRITFHGESLSIPYGDIDQLYLDEENENMEIVCTNVLCGTPLQGFGIPLGAPTAGTRNRCGGRRPPGDVEEEEEEVFVPDGIGGHYSASNTTRNGKQPLRRHTPRCQRFRRSRSMGRRLKEEEVDEEEEEEEEEEEWIERQEYLFLLHCPRNPPNALLPGVNCDTTTTMRGGRGLIGQPCPLRSVFDFLAPRVATRPLIGIAPLRRFHTARESMASHPRRRSQGPSDWMHWLRQRFGFSPFVEDSDEREERKQSGKSITDSQEGNSWEYSSPDSAAAAHDEGCSSIRVPPPPLSPPKRPSVAEVLGWNAPVPRPDSLASSLGYDWDRDVHAFLEQSYLQQVWDRSDSIEAAKERKEEKEKEEMGERDIWRFAPKTAASAGTSSTRRDRDAPPTIALPPDSPTYIHDHASSTPQPRISPYAIEIRYGPTVFC